MKKIMTMMVVFVFVLFSASAMAFDHHHGIWDILLKKHVIAPGGPVGFQVNYLGMKNDRALMGTCIAQLTSVSRDDFDTWSLNRQRAFLINAYNAFAIRLVLDHYPVDTIKDIGGWFTDPFDMAFSPLMGETLSLNEIERRLMALGDGTPDPRLHFLLFRVSRGCPPLKTDAVTHENIAALLESSLIDFLADADKNRFNPRKKRVELSSLFKWYEADFIAVYGSLEAFVRVYGDSISLLPGDSLDLVRDPIALVFLRYDWALSGH